jgi:hypothetical protein
MNLEDLKTDLLINSIPERNKLMRQIKTMILDLRILILILVNISITFESNSVQIQLENEKSMTIESLSNSVRDIFK